MSKLYFSRYLEEIYSESDLDALRLSLIEKGDTFGTGTLQEFINLCLVENNGELEELKTVMSICENGQIVYAESNWKTDLF